MRPRSKSRKKRSNAPEAGLGPTTPPQPPILPPRVTGPDPPPLSRTAGEGSHAAGSSRVVTQETGESPSSTSESGVPPPCGEQTESYVSDRPENADDGETETTDWVKTLKLRRGRWTLILPDATSPLQAESVEARKLGTAASPEPQRGREVRGSGNAEASLRQDDEPRRGGGAAEAEERASEAQSLSDYEEQLLLTAESMLWYSKEFTKRLMEDAQLQSDSDAQTRRILQEMYGVFSCTVPEEAIAGRPARVEEYERVTGEVSSPTIYAEAARLMKATLDRVTDLGCSHMNNSDTAGAEGKERQDTGETKEKEREDNRDTSQTDSHISDIEAFERGKGDYRGILEKDTESRRDSQIRRENARMGNESSGSGPGTSGHSNIN